MLDPDAFGLMMTEVAEHFLRSLVNEPNHQTLAHSIFFRKWRVLRVSVEREE
jgi:hypothetical protein